MSIPSRRGKPWSDEECLKLLQAVRNKESIDAIAANHERTRCGIRSRLRHLAAEYYFNENRPIEDIMKLTGLDERTINDAIKKREIIKERRTKKDNIQIKATEEQSASSVPNKVGILSVLTEIRDLAKEILELQKQILATR